MEGNGGEAQRERPEKLTGLTRNRTTKQEQEQEQEQEPAQQHHRTEQNRMWECRVAVKSTGWMMDG